MDDLLSADSVGTYLARRGVVDEGTPVEAEELTGGVSCVALRVRAGDRHLVVKQSLDRLRVADEWLAPRERAVQEAAALELAARIVPGSVPRLVDADPSSYALTIEHAPAGWRTWKDDLLAGRTDERVGRALGDYLAAWHGATAGDAQVRERFDAPEAFDALRVDPYYRTVMQRLPDLADAVAPYVDQMTARRRCLVHGDYSPKNVLVGDDARPWVVDWEVVHTGDPVFDVAFMSNHLMLKAIHRPQDADGYRLCALAFWRAYRAAVPPEVAPDTRYTLGHLGCLMVARVDGKSPAEYLTGRERALARSIGSTLLADPPATLEDAWHLLRSVMV